MNADYSKPVTGDLYSDWSLRLVANAKALLQALDPAHIDGGGTPTGTPTNAVRWNSANNYWEIYNGAAWGALTATYAINISGSAPWANITSKPTTLAGYGITDAPTKTGTGATGTWSINITGTAAVPAIGKSTIFIPAGAMIPTTTNGAVGPSQVELGTNKINFKCLDFADGATALHAQAMVAMPKSWDAGPVTCRFHWTFSSGSGGVVKWQVKAGAYHDNVALDQALGTAQAVTEAPGTASRLHLTADTSAITIANSPAARDIVIFDFFRDPTDGSDTSTVTARLIGVDIIYNSSGTDDT